ncbi:NAD-dependent epimerase/dehydratase family protein [Sandaracinus amylolyticus]|uniref:NAD-dependent epimerase/dehydratase family protein n=1 Tax=Sandaracinus amylolyticus TaxID=927083 RepID=UPI001F02BAB6|nr:NAD-dependent epimerase/dehydratase family protein [Sandaracinus amylolyticus]
MRVFVTGASGFVGGHLVEHLVRKGHDVRAMARSDRSAELVRRCGATPVRCDLDDVRAEHLAGEGAVIHAAARAEEWGTKEESERANVEGTTRVLEAARAAGVRRFVHVGTEAAIFAGRDLIDVDERAPYPTSSPYLYGITKAEAERRVLAASAPGFETLSIRPRLVWGPRDTSVLPAVLRMAETGRFAWLDGGRVRTSVTHVRNIAHALELALTRGRPGQAYFIADHEQHTVRDFLAQLVDAAAGVDLGTRNMPSSIARPLARVVESIWRALHLRSTPPMTRFAIDMMSSTVTVSTKKAREELGYAPIVTYQEGLAELRAERTTRRPTTSTASVPAS